jgi:hypothetical protein
MAVPGFLAKSSLYQRDGSMYRTPGTQVARSGGVERAVRPSMLDRCDMACIMCDFTGNLSACRTCGFCRGGSQF